MKRMVIENPTMAKENRNGWIKILVGTALTGISLKLILDGHRDIHITKYTQWMIDVMRKNDEYLRLPIGNGEELDCIIMKTKDLES